MSLVCNSMFPSHLPVSTLRFAKSLSWSRYYNSVMMNIAIEHTMCIYFRSN